MKKDWKLPVDEFGYAVVHQGRLDLRTAGPTIRAAKTNWLVAGCRMRVRDGLNDAAIDQMFAEVAAKPGNDFQLVKIKASVIERIK